MTTIAYKDGVIAYDSRITSDSLITDDDRDKRIERNGVSFFLSGPTCDYEKLISSYFGDAVKGTVDASALVLDKGYLKIIGWNEKDGCWACPVPSDRPYAIGSGSHFAWAAMDMGASAEQAVEAASRRDSSTGGKVRVYVAEKQEASHG